MYWIRYEMVQLNSQCFHGNVLAVSINQFLQWINMLLICYPVHMLLYSFILFLIEMPHPLIPFFHPLFTLTFASFLSIAHAQYEFPLQLKGQYI